MEGRTEEIWKGWTGDANRPVRFFTIHERTSPVAQESACAGANGHRAHNNALVHTRTPQEPSATCSRRHTGARLQAAVTQARDRRDGTRTTEDAGSDERNTRHNSERQKSVRRLRPLRNGEDCHDEQQWHTRRHTRTTTMNTGKKALRAYNEDDRTDKLLCAFRSVVRTMYSCATPVAVALVVLMLQ